MEVESSSFGLCLADEAATGIEEEEEEGEEGGGGLRRFPEELLQQVLCYLPLHEMIRAQLVCRSWHSALTSPDFLCLWSRRSSPSLWLLRYHSFDSTLFAFHPLSNLSLPIPRPPAPHSIVASSRGLICFLHPSSLSLFNPLTRLSLPIPLPSPLSSSSSSSSSHFGFTQQRFPLNRLFIIVCDFSASPNHPSHCAHLYDSATHHWFPLPQPPALAPPPHDQLPRSTQFFVWWNGKFCILLSGRVVTYDVHASLWGTLDLSSFSRIWNSRHMTLHVIRGRLLLEGNFRSQGGDQGHDPLLVGIVELDPTTLQWNEIACMPKELAQMLCNDAQPLHSKYTSYSDADCDHICFTPFPTKDEEQLVFYHLEENSWTSMHISHRGWHPYFGSSSFRGWALQPDFTALP